MSVTITLTSREAEILRLALACLLKDHRDLLEDKPYNALLTEAASINRQLPVGKP